MATSDPTTPTTDDAANGHPEGMGTQGGEDTLPEATPTPNPDAPTPAHPMASALLAQEASQHLRAVQGNLEGFAAQIADGEFGPNGAGEAGRVWRTLANLTDPTQLVDAWGEIMATSTGLWGIGRLAEAIELVDAAARSFPLPDVWKKRVEDSLKEAKDYQAAREAESAFNDGRDEEALQHADRISNQTEAEHYRRILKQRLDRRRKQRKAIFTIAAVAIVSLLIASGIAISTMGRISIAPPAPNFSGFGDALEKVSNDLRQQRDERDGTPSNDTGTVEAPALPLDGVPNTDPTQGTPTVGEPTDEPTTPSTDTTPTTNGMPSLDTLLQAPDPVPQAPIAETTPTVTPQTGETAVAPAVDVTPDPAPTQEQPVPETSAPTDVPTGDTTTGTNTPAATQSEPPSPSAQTQPPQPAAAPADLRGTCLLGYAGLNEAQQLVRDAQAALSAQDLQTVQGRLTDFTATLEKACMKANLSATELLSGVAALDPTQVRSVAESILLGQQ